MFGKLFNMKEKFLIFKELPQDLRKLEQVEYDGSLYHII